MNGWSTVGCRSMRASARASVVVAVLATAACSGGGNGLDFAGDAWETRADGDCIEIVVEARPTVAGVCADPGSSERAVVSAVALERGTIVVFGLAEGAVDEVVMTNTAEVRAAVEPAGDLGGRKGFAVEVDGPVATATALVDGDPVSLDVPPV